MTDLNWQVRSLQPPESFVQAVQAAVPNGKGNAITQLLWQRGIQDPEAIAGFLDPDRYQPASPFEFGEEMRWAVARLQQARQNQEVVAIWGDFDADGVTATSVLWDGLGQFFRPQETLVYYIPNRLTESHGLSQQGITTLHAKGCRLIVTCDTGSTNLAEIEFAQSLGMETIVTDHHTLPVDRPPVTAIINPRYFLTDHPLATLSGVAVAYKLVEALYETLPDVPQKPLTELLDLVAIGLIADLVELKGDCRYLAQRGIQQLQKQTNPKTQTRPGIAKLLELCKRSGDRPTDISFGLGPRINAVSRIQGDAHFCVELLTSRDPHLCAHLAEATELANARRKAVQQDVMQQVTARLTHLDLSTTDVIVLADQWPIGVLGLVAGQVAQTYDRPTILLSLESGEGEESTLARGSARSAHGIDLYQLVKDQEHLLHRFGGHPFAAGLSLPIVNLPLFTEAINQQVRRSDRAAAAGLAIDLVVTVAQLGPELFQELKLLEPCGMGNPVPRLLIQNCWFTKVWNKNIQDWKGGKVQYIKTEFELQDDSTAASFAGVWWGHYRDEIPADRCDAVVELDFNAYQKRYQVRLIALHPCTALAPQSTESAVLLDCRKLDRPPTLDALPLLYCPRTSAELQAWFRRAQQQQRPLAIAYPIPTLTPPSDLWQKLVGIAKYLSRTGQTATRQQLLEKLDLGDRALQFGFKTLTHLGFSLSYANHALEVTWQASAPPASEAEISTAIQDFFTAIREEQFHRQYFAQAPLTTLQAIAAQTQ
ncbi:MAG TPA: single-stranded-DNA-specific exonuclease RecJ [Thermosynechococcaceae cyanobacterium]